MHNEQRHTTKELEAYIQSIYAKLEPLTRRDGVYRPLDDHFGMGIPNGRDGSFCFSDENGYHYGVNEQGLLRESIVTRSLFEITYRVLSSDIFWMANSYERGHREAGKDSRRLLFQKELQYWSALGTEYAKQAQRKIDEWLTKAPYSD